MKIDKTSLKAAIRAHTSVVGGDRRRATQLFQQGRQLRRSPSTTAEGWQLHSEATNLRPDSGFRQYGRELTLAAAFLNNTPFNRCERELGAPWWARRVHQHVSQCYPKGGAPSLAIIEAWFESGTATRHTLMTAPAELQQAA